MEKVNMKDRKKAKKKKVTNTNFSLNGKGKGSQSKQKDVYPSKETDKLSDLQDLMTEVCGKIVLNFFMIILCRLEGYILTWTHKFWTKWLWNLFQRVNLWDMD